MMTLETTQTVPLTMIEDGTIRITGTRIPLEVVIHHHQRGDTPESIHEGFPTLNLADIYAAISYYLSHRAEVEDYLRRQEEAAAELRRKIEASPYHKDTTGLRDLLRARWDAMHNNGHQA